MLAMSIEEQAGVAVANKKLAERRFEKFKKGIEEVKDRGFFYEYDIQKIKDPQRDTEETTTRFEEIITFLEGVYSGKERKKEKELEDIVKCFEVITERRDTVIKMVKEATTGVETSRNATEEAKAKVKENNLNYCRRSGDGRSEEPRQGVENNSNNLLEDCHRKCLESSHHCKV